VNCGGPGRAAASPGAAAEHRPLRLQTAEAIAAWRDRPELDAWITFASWHDRLRDEADLVELPASERLYRGTPAALLVRIEQRALGLAFLEFLRSEECHAIFRAAGFGVGDQPWGGPFPLPRRGSRGIATRMPPTAQAPASSSSLAGEAALGGHLRPDRAHRGRPPVGGAAAARPLLGLVALETTVNLGLGAWLARASQVSDAASPR
jgi:hypothetical protein